MMWLIALVPAIAVILVAIQTASKTATIIAALFATALGVLSGNPAFMALDVGAVVLATVFAFNTVTFNVRDPASKAAKAAELAALTKKLDAIDEGIHTALHWGVVVFVVAVGGAFFFSHRPSPPVPSPSPSPMPSQMPFVVPTASWQSPSPPPRTQQAVVAPAVKPQRQTVKKTSSTMSPMQRCVAIHDEAKMVTCLDQLH